MRHAAPGAQCTLSEHRLHQLIGVQAAFHQHAHLSQCRQLGGLGGCGVAVLHGQDLGTVQVDACLFGYGAQAGFGGDQHRCDQAVGCRIHGAAQGLGVAGVHHCTALWRQSLAHGQQVAQSRLRVEELDLRRVRLGQAHLLLRRQHPGQAVQHGFAFLVHGLAIEFHLLALFDFAQHGGGHGQGVAHAHRAGEMQVLRHIDGARPGKLCAQQGGDQCAAPHAVRDHPVEQGVVGVVAVEVGGVGVARNGCKGLDVGHAQGAQESCALAYLQLVVSDVLKPFGGGCHVQVRCEQ